jgi:hypothetical protein
LEYYTIGDSKIVYRRKKNSHYLYRTTYSWFIQVRNNANQLNVTGDMFLHKATSFAQKLNVQDKVSHGWLQKFLK